MMDVVLIKTVYRMEWMDHCAVPPGPGSGGVRNKPTPPDVFAATSSMLVFSLKIGMESVCIFDRSFLNPDWLLHRLISFLFVCNTRRFAHDLDRRGRERHHTQTQAGSTAVQVPRLPREGEALGSRKKRNETQVIVISNSK